MWGSVEDWPEASERPLIRSGGSLNRHAEQNRCSPAFVDLRSQVEVRTHGYTRLLPELGWLRPLR